MLRVFSVRLLAIVSALVLTVASGLLSDYSRARAACPVDPPKPLRVMYLMSDLVIVARVGKSEVLRMEKASDTYVRKLIKTNLETLKTLKGKPGSVIPYVHWDYEYVNNGEAPTLEDAKEAGEEDKEEIADPYAEGNKVLMFLQHEPDGSGYELTDGRYFRNLKEVELNLHVQRIQELAAILEAPQPDKVSLVEWFLRCAAEPVTRWSAIYELNASYQALESYEEEQAAKLTAPPPEPEKAGVNETPVGVTQNSVVLLRQFSHYESDKDWARLLTPAQKETLANLLFIETKPNVTDYRLMELVGHLDDPRFVPFLLRRLREDESKDYYLVEDLMEWLVNELEDEPLGKIVEAYQETELELNEGDDEDSDSADEAKQTAKEKELERLIEKKRAALKEKFLARAEKLARRR